MLAYLSGQPVECACYGRVMVSDCLDTVNVASTGRPEGITSSANGGRRLTAGKPWAQPVLQASQTPTFLHRHTGETGMSVQLEPQWTTSA